MPKNISSHDKKERKLLSVCPKCAVHLYSPLTIPFHPVTLMRSLPKLQVPKIFFTRMRSDKLQVIAWMILQPIFCSCFRGRHNIFMPYILFFYSRYKRIKRIITRTPSHVGLKFQSWVTTFSVSLCVIT